MTTVTVQRQINAPRTRVFALMSDFANADQNVEAIGKVEVLTSLGF